MKNSLYGIVVFASLLLTACSQSRNINRSYDDYSEYSDNSSDNSITYEQFYDDLSPYGQWRENPEFGRVWSPRQTGFRPYYSDGHWAYTNYGWTWVSDYNWGWATFHYGRWYYDNFDGWMWVPGNEWAPAWVSWRRNSDYYGWAPLCPQRRNGSYYELQNDQWAFVPNQYIHRNDLNNYYINRQNNVTIINNTTVINNTRVINNTQYQQGPSVAEVEQVTKTKIRTFPVKQSPVPGDSKLQDGALHIYKPVVKQNNINSVNTKQRPSENMLPADQTQDIRTMRSVDNNRRIKNLDRNSVNTRVNQNPDAADQRITNNLPAPARVDQSSDINNRDFNTSRRRKLREYQQQSDANVQQAPADVRPELNTRRQLQERIIEDQQNNQQSNPVINQRPSKPMQNTNIERPSNSFERRPQSAPQSNPDNSNRTNAGNKLRNFR